MQNFLIIQIFLSAKTRIAEQHKQVDCYIIAKIHQRGR